MRAFARWMAVGIGLFAFGCHSRAEARPLFRYRLEELHSGRNLLGGRTVSTESGGTCEDCVFRVDSASVLCERFQGAVLTPAWHFYFPQPSWLARIADVSGDGNPELLVTSGRPSGPSFFSLYDPWSSAHGPIYRLGPFLEGSPLSRDGKAGALDVVGLLDADDDGRLELFVGTCPFVAGEQMRRLWAHDALSGKLLWTFDLGPQVNGVRLLVRNGGAERHLLVTTYAPANPGFSCNGTDNDSSYILSLTLGGKLEWCLRTGSYFSGSMVVVGDLDEDGQDDLVGGLMLGPEDKGDRDRPQVFRIDPGSGKILRFSSFSAGVHYLHLDDLNRDGRPEIVIAGQDQKLHILDRSLKPRRETGRTPCTWVAGIDDLNNDRAHDKEVVCVFPPRVNVVSRRGTLLTSLHQGPAVTASLVKMGARTLLLTSEGIGWQLHRVESPLLRPWIPALIALAALAVVVTSRRARRRRAGTGDTLAIDRAREELVDAMAAFDHGGHSLRRLDIMINALWSWNEILQTPGEGPEAAAEVFRAFEQTLLPEVSVLAGRAVAAGIAGECAETMVLRVKSAAEEIRLLLREPSGEGEEDHRRENALIALKEVDACRKRVRQALERAYSTPLEETVARALRSYPLRDSSIDLRPEPLVEPGLDRGARIYISRQVLLKILEDLLDNAVHAVQGCSMRRIEVVLGAEDLFCRIDVRDTGRGIPPEKREWVFQEGTSTRADGRGGFGLYYAARQVARFRGRILVPESMSPGVTIVRIRLRLVEDWNEPAGG